MLFQESESDQAGSHDALETNRGNPNTQRTRKRALVKKVLNFYIG